MFSRLALASAALVVAALPATAQTWKIDTAHSSASFAVKHMMVSNVHGRFGKVEGTVVYDGKNVAGAQVDYDRRDHHHDRQREARRAPQEPRLLRRRRVPDDHVQEQARRSRAPGKFKLIGDLTMRGKTKEVALDAEGPTDPVTAQSSQRVGVTATTTLNRHDFGVSWSRTMDGGGYVVGDDVKVTIELELIKQTS